MVINTNQWNKIRYTIYGPVYDWVISFFAKYRKQAIDTLKVTDSSKVLVVGCGAGNDLEYIKDINCEVDLIDITPDMIRRTNEKLRRYKINGNAQVMDAQLMTFEDESFDFITCNLILAVCPDPIACFKEVERVLKPGGRIVVFDKFLNPGETPSWFRLFFNLMTNFIATDINRVMEDIASHTQLKLISKEDVLLRKNFKIFIYEKN